MLLGDTAPDLDLVSCFTLQAIVSPQQVAATRDIGQQVSVKPELAAYQRNRTVLV
jgi:hypothetical protein